MPSDSQILEELKAKFAEQQPSETPTETDEEEVETPGADEETPEAGETADAPDIRETALLEREQRLLEREQAIEEKHRNLERGYQKKFQAAAKELKEARARSKSEREVAFLAQKMAENPTFAAEVAEAVNRHGIRMPDITPEDVEETIRRVLAEEREQAEEARFEETKAEYQELLSEERDRLMKEHKLNAKEADAIFLRAADPDVPLLRPGMSASQVRKALDTAARAVLYPRAASVGQKALLDRAKGKVRSAVATATRDHTPPPKPPADWKDAEARALEAYRATKK